RLQWGEVDGVRAGGHDAAAGRERHAGGRAADGPAARRRAHHWHGALDAGRVAAGGSAVRMNLMCARTLARAAAIVVALCCSLSVAQQYPNRAVRLVVPFAPGGSTDTLARIVGQQLAQTLGQSVIVDNRPAAGGVTGSELVARAQPDGYTLLIGSIATMVIAGAMHPKLPYDVM